MEKRIQDIIDLANVYGWEIDLVRDRQVNLRNNNNDLVPVYWSSHRPNYTVTHKPNKQKPTTKKAVDLLFIEDVFKNNSMTGIKPMVVITFGMVDNFLKSYPSLTCLEAVGKFKDWLPK